MDEMAESVSGILREADRRLRSVASDDVHEMCAIVRRAAVGLGPVDTFYVGLYQGENTVVMPYVFSDGEDLGPESSRYGQSGLSHWMRSSGQIYRFAQDDGRLCQTALPMGDGTPSQDIVAVPLFDLDGHTVLGMINAQSLEPGVFDDAFVEAFAWLAQALSYSLPIGQRSSSRAPLYLNHPDLDSSRFETPVELLNAATDRLERVADLVAGIKPQVAGSDPDMMTEHLDRIIRECRRAGAELAVMATRTPQTAPQPEPTVNLTRREQEIADLIVHESLSNAAIANRLMISEPTVKTHVSSVLRKLGVQQRSELMWVLGSKT
jgi:DNA-binding CsgD family transcriptional regulator